MRRLDIATGPARYLFFVSSRTTLSHSFPVLGITDGLCYASFLSFWATLSVLDFFTPPLLLCLNLLGKLARFLFSFPLPFPCIYSIYALHFHPVFHLLLYLYFTHQSPHLYSYHPHVVCSTIHPALSLVSIATHPTVHYLHLAILWSISIKPLHSSLYFGFIRVRYDWDITQCY